MNELKMSPNPALECQDATALSIAVVQMTEVMRGMAEMLRSTNERMTALEQQVRMLTKVTPAQAASINMAIRNRAAELCLEYRACGNEKAVATAIRKEVKLVTGVASVRELPRCQYSIAMDQIGMWDDYKTMRRVRERAAESSTYEGCDHAER